MLRLFQPYPPAQEPRQAAHHMLGQVPMETISHDAGDAPDQTPMTSYIYLSGDDADQIIAALQHSEEVIRNGIAPQMWRINDAIDVMIHAREITTDQIEEDAQFNARLKMTLTTHGEN